jgi:hypothetical protein
MPQYYGDNIVRHTLRQWGIQGRLLYSIVGAIIVFFVCQFALLYREWATLDDQKLVLQSEIHTKERRLDDATRQLRNRERDVYRMEHRVVELEEK